MPAKEPSVQVYLTLEEREKLKRLAGASGYSMSAYMRRLLQFVVPKDRPPLDYQIFIWHLGKIGTNLNQIAKIANQSGNVKAADYQANYEELCHVVLDIQRAILMPEKLDGGD